MLHFLFETTDLPSCLSETCQRRHMVLVVNHYPLYKRFRAWAPSFHPLLTSCQWDLSVSQSREALVCVSGSGSALDYVWMTESKGGPNYAVSVQVISEKPRNVSKAVILKTLLVVLVVVHMAGKPWGLSCHNLKFVLSPGCVRHLR